MRVSRWIFLTLALTLAFESTSTALAEVYRWKDSQGKVHFSDQPISTDPEVVNEVVVPSPNVANAFKPRPHAPAGVMETPVGGLSADPTEPQDSLRPRGVAAQSKESCRLKKAAYEASRACFDTCGKNIGSGVWGDNRSGRNNAGCEHCVDQPMPRC